MRNNLKNIPPQIRKNKWLFLIVLLSLCIIGAETTTVKASAFSTATPEQTNIGISATVDNYLAVYMRSDGNIRAETNIGNEYFADENVCVVNY